MARVSEELSKAQRNVQGKTDANLANDALHLGGIEANEYATKSYVQEYHNTKETAQKSYIDQQDQAMLNEAKEYTNSQIRNQDFSGFAKVTDVQALDEKLSEDIEEGLSAQKSYTDQKTQAIVDDVNANFQDVENSIGTLNSNVNNLFQSVSNGKGLVAEAITDKGVPTSATDSFSTMASNISSISSGGGSIDPNFVNTGDATATADKIASGYTAYAKGQKLYGTLGQGGDATPYDILQGKTAWVNNQLVEGVLTINESSGKPSYDIGAVEKVYGTVPGMLQEYPYLGVSNIPILIDIISVDMISQEGIMYLNLAYIDGTTLKIESAGETTSYDLATDLGISVTSNSDILMLKVSEEKADFRNLVIVTKTEVVVYRIILKEKETSTGTKEYYDIDTTNKVSTQDINMSDSDNYFCNIAFDYDNSPNGKLYFALTHNLFGTGGSNNYPIYILELDMEFDDDINQTLNKTLSVKSEFIPKNNINYNNYWYTAPYVDIFFPKGISGTLCVSCHSGATILIQFIEGTYSYKNDVLIIEKCTYGHFITRDLKYVIKAGENKLYKTNINLTELSVSLIEEKQINNILPKNIYLSGISSWNAWAAYFDINSKFLFIITSIGTTKTMNFYAYAVDFEQTNCFEQLYTHSISAGGNLAQLKLMSNIKGAFITSVSDYNNRTLVYQTVNDYQTVVALKYQGDYYYKQASQGELTASQTDVKSGKTFIGASGIVETGTMEVLEQ